MKPEAERPFRFWNPRPQALREIPCKQPIFVVVSALLSPVRPRRRRAIVSRGETLIRDKTEHQIELKLQFAFAEWRLERT